MEEEEESTLSSLAEETDWDWPMSWLRCYQSSFHKKKKKRGKNILYASFCMTCWAFIDFISFSWINLKSVPACEGEHWRKRRHIFQFGGFRMGFKSSWNNVQARKPGSIRANQECSGFERTMNMYLGTSLHFCFSNRIFHMWDCMDMFVTFGHLAKNWMPAMGQRLLTL